MRALLSSMGTLLSIACANACAPPTAPLEGPGSAPVTHVPEVPTCRASWWPSSCGVTRFWIDPDAGRFTLDADNVLPWRNAPPQRILRNATGTPSQGGAA